MPSIPAHAPWHATRVAAKPTWWALFASSLLLYAGTAWSQTTVFVNELHYDNDGGDTGEAVEIVGPATTDLSGWSVALYNGSTGQLYDTINLAGVLPDQCGGFGTLFFAQAGIQNGSPDGLALVDDGGVVVQFLSYEGTFTAADGPAMGVTSIDMGVSEPSNGSAAESLQLGGNGTVAEDFTWGGPSAESFGACNPGQSFGGSPTTLEIFAVQGAGLTSPVVGQRVTTEDAIVTAVGPDGFVIQTPDARADVDAETSNGLFVFTASAPTVQVGDQVDVTGTVVEFFDFTQMDDNGLVVNIDSSGNALPAAVAFGALVPSPDQPQPDTELERFESMRVAVSGGTICSGNQAFGSDPVAEVFIAATADRCFREPGIAFPGLPDLPVWDGNPEVFELDADRLAPPSPFLVGGSTFDAEGVIGFEFGDYELWPTMLSVTTATLPRAVRPRAVGERTVSALNLERLFDNIDDPADTNGQGEVRNDAVVSLAEYDRRRLKLARYVLEVLDAPDVLAVEEVEKLGVLQELANEISSRDATVVYTAFLIEGNDVGTIDVGFLVRDTVTGAGVSQLGKDELFNFDGVDDLTHDRPPLLLEGDLGIGTPFPVAVLVVHGRSLSNVDSPTSGPRVRAKRLAQAQSTATMVQDFQTANPSVPLLVVGDFNAFEFTDGYVDVVGQIAGDAVPADNLLSGPDLVDPNLDRLVLAVDAADRYSFLFRGNAQVLDLALGNQAAMPFVRGFAFGRGNADAARDLQNDDTTLLRSSDHDGLVVYLGVTSTMLFSDGFESGDTSAWTVTVP